MKRERIREKEVIRYVPRCTMLEDTRKGMRLLLPRPYTGRQIAESFAQAGTFEIPDPDDGSSDGELRWIGKTVEYNVGYRLAPAGEVSCVVEVAASVAVYVKNPPGYEPWVYNSNYGSIYTLQRLVADEEYKEVMLFASGRGIPSSWNDVDWGQADNWSNPEEYETFRKILHAFGHLLCDCSK